MELSEEKRIPAGRDVVWKALNDPEVLRQCIPGCESVEKRSDTEFTAKVTVAVGPVKAKFTGEVTLSDIDPPNGYTISGKGSGGVAGFGKGSAVVKLRDEGADTVLAYQVQASVGGKLAQIGQRLVDSTAKKLADEFFANFVKAVAPQGAAAAAEPAAATPPQAAPSPAPSSAPGKAGPGWGAVLIVAAAGLALLWYLSTR